MRGLSWLGMMNIMVGAILFIIGMILLVIDRSSDSMSFDQPIVIAFLFSGIAILLLAFFYKKGKRD